MELTGNIGELHWSCFHTKHSILTLFSGNAKLEGMVTQLDLTGDRYNIALVMKNLLSCSIVQC